MSELIQELVTNNDGKPTTDSLKVALKFGKRHDNVLRDIKKILNSKKFLTSSNLRALYFSLSEYEDAKGERREFYQMSRKGFTLLAMGFTGDDAMDFKVEFIEAFDKMETQLKKLDGRNSIEEIMKNPEFGIRMLTELQQSRQDVARKDQIIHRLEPLARVAESYSSAKGDTTVGIFAKSLRIGEKTMFESLRRDGYLISTGDQLNHPYQQYIDCGWLILKKRVDRKTGFINYQTLVTPKGQVQLAKKYGKGARSNAKPVPSNQLSI